MNTAVPKYDVRLLVWLGAAVLTAIRFTLYAMDIQMLSELAFPNLLAEEVDLTAEAVLLVAGLVLLIPALVTAHPVLLVLVSFLGYLTSWGEFLGMVASTMLGMWRGKAALPLIIATTSAGLVVRFFVPWPGQVRAFSTLQEVPGEFLLTLPVCVLCGLLGENLQAREELRLATAREAEFIQNAHDARVAQARVQERDRIAREMHDSLAHRLSLVALHAGAMSSARALTPDQARDGATQIHHLVSEAGQDLRQILAVLHDTTSGDEGRALWEDVVSILEREREAGQDVQLQMSSDWRHTFDVAAPGVRHGVLRATQEMLTNARKHGSDRTVKLDCEVSGDGVLMLRCVNACSAAASPPQPGEGLGLEGLKERLRLLRGSLHVLRDAERFTVLAILPINPSAETQTVRRLTSSPPDG